MKYASIILLVLFLLCAGVVGCSERHGLTIIAADGIFEWFMDPAVRYVGAHDRTYIGYYASTGAGDGWVGVKCWDENSKTLSQETMVWDNWGYDGGVPGDDHACPSLIVLRHQTGDNAIRNGRILIAAAEHGSRTEGKGRLETRRSSNPEDISSWESVVGIRTSRATYALLAEVSGGTIFLFTRLSHMPASGEFSWYYYTSTDAGDTWQGPELFFKSEWPALNYVMLDINSDGSEIHFILNRAKRDDPEDGFWRYRDVFYIYCDSYGTWRTADGTARSLPLDFSDADHTPDLVYESDATPGEEDWTWLWDIRVDSNDEPYLLSVNQPDMGSWYRRALGKCNCAGDVLRHSYSDGSWQTETVCKTGIFGDGYYYPAGAVLDERDMNTVYAAAFVDGGFTEIQKWQKVENNWKKTEDITQSSNGDNIRPMLVRNAGEHFKLLWSYVERYQGYKSGEWESMILAYPGFLTE